MKAAAMTQPLMIAGQRSLAQSGKTFPVYAPANGEVISEVASGGKPEVDAAVVAAREGFTLWSGLAPREREAILLKAADIVAAEGEARFLSTLIDESGSAISKARGEINYTVDLLRTAAGEVRRLYGETFPNDRPDRMSMVFRNPLGVVAVVSPFNAPLALLAKMTAFPLAAGNSVVIKPSSETPLTALAFGQLLVDAGLPAAAISVVPGSGSECGAALVAHAGIDCIALTGSTETGIKIGKQAMERFRPVQLELGGKSALLVLRDADPVKAAKIAAQGIFTHGGQICMANSRIVVEREVYDDFIAALKAEAESIKIGDLYDPLTTYGPLINARAVDQVMSHIEAALADGAQLLTGGRIHEGLVVQPTVLLSPVRDKGVWREESFGPVTSVVAVDSLDEAIAVANDSEFGLSGAVLTKNIQWGMKAAKEINAGSVHIGMHSYQSNALAPIGGSGFSGIGRSGGAYSIEEFTDVKWISVELGDSV